MKGGNDLYILSGSKKEIVNSDFVERFCVVVKSDASLIVLSYSDTRPPVTLAKYKDAVEAKGILAELFAALAGGQTYFEMPDSLLLAEERGIKDARVKRKGGS